MKYLRRTTSANVGNGLGTTINNLRGAARIDLRTTIKSSRRTTSAAAGNDLAITVNYLRRTTSGVAGSCQGSTI